MKRLAVAVVLAAGLHGAAFWATGPRTRPILPMARSQAVTLNLVSVQAPAKIAQGPAPEKVQPPPKPKPEPMHNPTLKPKRPPKAAPRPRMRPRPAPRPPAIDPLPAPPVAMEAPPAGPPAEEPMEETETSASADAGPVSRREHAAVQASVPLYDLNPPPVYPRMARRRNYQGTVLLDVRVSAKGTVAEVRLARSSGHGILDRSAMNSVRHWRFEPARRGDRPIETWVQVPVRFELREL
jgi:periplasmic protein TonB